MEHPEKIEHRRNADGSEFIVVWAQDLLDVGYDVQKGGKYDVTIRLRDGQRWSPWELYDAEYEAELLEDEEVDGYWLEDDEDDSCAYCGIGGLGDGGRCNANGWVRCRRPARFLG